MLRNRGIRTKLLAVLALPVAVLLVAAVAVSVLQLRSASRASQVEGLAAGAGTLGRLVSDLQAERSVSLAALDHKPVQAELRTARRATDASLVAAGRVLADVRLAASSPQATAAVAQADRGHSILRGLRAGVDSGSRTREQVGEEYTAVVAADIDLPARIGDGLQDRGIGARLAAYSAAQRLVELATQQRDVGLQALAVGGAPSVALAGELRRLAADSAAAQQAYLRDGSPSQVAGLERALGSPPAARSQLAAQQAALVAGARPTFTSADWRALANTRIDALSSLLAPVASDVAAVAHERARTARDRALLVLLAGAGLLLLVGGLGVVLARALTRPLRRLTAAAGELSAELPLMVERMATSGSAPQVRLPEIPVTSDDEVGRLAQAFVEVNETTVRVAQEQAALRESIAQMFVHVARRNHVLLSRQLAFIDQLERTEEDPDTLDNLFRLDHLATRMRRNAESLIVLAGIDAGRRLRRPMPLSDVVRTAVSEIERYDRVDLDLQADPPLVGHLALTAAHLLAELLENATQFSDPGTRVVTSTEPTATGVRITVADHGLGLTPKELADATARITNPQVSEVLGSQRLGLYVVGRLARRLDAVVSVRAGDPQGTVVTVDLPAAVFVPGTVAPVPAVLSSPDHGSDRGSALSDGLPDAGLPHAAPSEPMMQPWAEPVVQRWAEPVVEPSDEPMMQPWAEPVVQRWAELVVEPSDEPVVEPSLGRSPAAEPGTGSATAREIDPATDLAPEPSGEPAGRPGIFGSFRARRPQPAGAAAQGTEPTTEPSPGSTAEPPPAPAAPPAFLPVDADALLDEESVEFVPVLAPSSPLPVRGAGAPRRSVLPGQPTSEQLEPVTEPLAVPVPHPVTEVLTAPAAEPFVAVEPLQALPVPSPDAAAVLAPEPALPSRPALAATGLPALDILPERAGGRGLRRRGKGRVPTLPTVPTAPTLPAVPARPAGAPTQPLGVADRSPLGGPAADAGSTGSPQLSRTSSDGLGDQPFAASASTATSPFEAAPSSGQPFGSASQLFAASAPGSQPFAGAPFATQPAGPVSNGHAGTDSVADLAADRTTRTHPVPEPAPSSLFAAAPVPVPTVAEIAAGPVQPPAGPAHVAGSAAPTEGDRGWPAAAQPEPVPAPSSLFAPAPGGPEGASRTAGGLPATGAVAASTEPAPASQTLRERSAMASQALSELSALSSYTASTGTGSSYTPSGYSPSGSQAAGSAPPLARRSPQASSAAQLAQPADEPLGARRGTRNAADVRSMLSGFREGVERGRATPPVAGRPAGSPAGPAAGPAAAGTAATQD